MVKQLCDRDGGASILDHDLTGNKIRNFSENESGWASIPNHPYGGNLKKIREEFKTITFFET